MLSTAYHLGVAIELAAKGAIVEATGAPPPAKGHPIAKLCQQAGLQLSSDDVALAERLEEAVTWWGRYATPTKPERFQDAQERDLRHLVLPQDRNTAESLLRRLGALCCQ